MNNQPEYIIEVHEFGFVFKSAPGINGIPASALHDCQKLFGKKDIMDGGIAKALHGIFAIASKENAKRWRAYIAENLEKQAIPKELKWLRGTDIGNSSVTLFIALTKTGAEEARYMEGVTIGATPRDIESFELCRNLLNLFPEWKSRLPEVAIQYPDWKPFVEAWPELEKLQDEKNTTHLQIRINEIRPKN